MTGCSPRGQVQRSLAAIVGIGIKLPDTCTFSRHAHELDATPYHPGCVMVFIFLASLPLLQVHLAEAGGTVPPE